MVEYHKRWVDGTVEETAGPGSLRGARGEGVEPSGCLLIRMIIDRGWDGEEQVISCLRSQTSLLRMHAGWNGRTACLGVYGAARTETPNLPLPDTWATERALLPNLPHCLGRKISKFRSSLHSAVVSRVSLCLDGSGNPWAFI